MFKIGKLFHLTHVVDDLDAIDRWLDDVFACQRFYHGYEKLAGREASLVVVSNIVLEPMMPARVEELRNESVKKFHDRFGQHLHSIAWYVDDLAAISAALANDGRRLFNILGRQVQAPDAKGAVWTHPRETYGQLEFAEYGDFIKDPRVEPGWTDQPWREHPLGLQAASHVGVVVSDLAGATRLYTEVLDGTVVHTEDVEGRRRSVFVALGEDSMVELIEPRAKDSYEGQDLARNGDGIHSLVYRTSDLGRAGEFLESKGMHPELDETGTLLIGPDEAFGMVVGFTERMLGGGR